MSRAGSILRLVGPKGDKGDKGDQGPEARTLTRSLSVVQPVLNDDITIGFADVAFRITLLRAIVRGSSPALTWTLRFHADRSAVGTEVIQNGVVTSSQTAGSDLTVFGDASIPANSWYWLEVTALTGTVDEFHLDIFAEEET